METRAAALGGTFALRDHEPPGTLVEWRVPLATSPADGPAARRNVDRNPLAFFALRTRIASCCSEYRPRSVGHWCASVVRLLGPAVRQVEPSTRERMGGTR